LLQNDGGVPVSNNKAAVIDRQKLKAPATLKTVVSANTVKRKDGSLETFANMNSLQPVDDSTTLVGTDSDSRIIHRIQKASTSEPSTMVTNVRTPVESFSSDSVIVSSGKLPAMNHLTAVTANVQQNYSSQNSLVNIFQRQMNAVASSALPNQQKASISTNLINNQLVNRMATGQNENQVLAVGQNQKFDVRVINVPSSQHQLLQSQQPLPKQLLQQQQQQLLVQHPHQQHLMQQQKSVILPRSTQGAKINASVQELNKFKMGQNTPIVSSLMVAGSRLVNQFPLNQSLPQTSNASNSNDPKFDNLLSDRNGFADIQGITSVTDQMPVAGMVMTEANTGQINKSDGRSLVQNGNSVVTCASKTFTFTNANLSQNSTVTNNLAGAATAVNTKMNPTVYNSNMNALDKLNSNVAQMMPSSVVYSLYNSSASCYQNNVVTNTSAVSSDSNSFIAGNQTGDAQSVVFSKSELVLHSIESDI
jgi:hypothetical protein